MINRRRRPAEEAPSIIIASSDDGFPSKPLVALLESKRATRGAAGAGGGRQRRRTADAYYYHREIILGFIFACLLWGGVLLAGSLSSSPSAEVGEEEEEEEEGVTKFPDGWESYSYEDVRHHFDCASRSKDDEKPLPSAKDWELMRRKFTEVVDDTKRWDDDPVPPTLGYSLERGVPYPPPYYAEYSPGRGRGVFASRDIAEGELVHDGTRSDVIFPDASAWRRYVFSLPRDMACDSTDWHWMQRLEEGGKYFMLAGMNISSLMNSGGREFGPGRSPNAMPESSTSGRFYATRDIAEGDEILTDYDAYYTNWKEVGL